MPNGMHKDVLLRIGADEADLKRGIERSKELLRDWTNRTKSEVWRLEAYMSRASVLMQEGINPGGLKVGIEQATNQWNQFFAAMKENLGLTETETVKFDNRMKTAFGGRPRFSALSYLSSQLGMLSYDLAGASGATRTLTGAFSMMQSGAMAGGVAMSYVLVGTVALTAALALIKLTTHESSKTFEDYRKKLKETKEEQKKFNDEIKRYNELIQPAAISGTDIFSGKVEKAVDPFEDFFASMSKGTDSLLYFNVAMSDAHSEFGRMTDEQSELFSVMSPLDAERQRELKLLELEGALIKDESIPNLQALVGWYDKEIARVESLLTGTIADIENKKILNDLYKEQIGLQKQITDALLEAAPYDRLKDVKDWLEDIVAQYKIWLYEQNKILAQQKEEFMKTWRIMERKPLEVYKTWLEAQIALIETGEVGSETWARLYDAIERTNKALKKGDSEMEKLPHAWMGYANQIASAFQITTEGIELRWAEMITNMINQLAQSGLAALIVHLIHPEWSFAELFKGRMGFQYGTPYVPETGLYGLHKGEAVIPASQNISNVQNYGGAVNNYYLINLDVEKLTRKSIVPIIEKLSHDRKTKILTV